MSERENRKGHAPGCVMRRSDFTLNELLFIVLVLLFFATLLAPSMMEVKSVYKKSVCVDNLMSLGKANALYAEDQGCYAPAATNAFARWHGALRENPAKRPDSSKAFLRPYMKGRDSLRPCPLFEEVVEESAPAPEKGGGGYGYNENIGSLRAVQTQYDLWDAKCKASGIKPSDLVNARETIMFAETATKADASGRLDITGRLVESSICTSYDTYNRGRPAWGTPEPTINFRHNGAALTTWSDGHVSGESACCSKDGWSQYGIGFVGSRLHSAFVPKTPPAPPKEDAQSKEEAQQ